MRVLSGLNACEAFLVAVGAVGAIAMAVGSRCFFGGRTHVGQLMGKREGRRVGGCRAVFEC